MERPKNGFEPPVNPRATHVSRGTLVVSLSPETLKSLLAITKRTAQRPGQFLSGLVDKELKHQEREAALATKFIAEEHGG